MSEVIVGASWRDYLEMCKPRVVLLMLICSVAGMFLATSSVVPLDVLIYGNIGIALVAGSAAVVNHIADAHIDSRMARTQSRPVATGRVSNRDAIIFSAVTGIIGLGMLWFLINPLTAWLNLASWVGYGLIYTFFLKRATPQNIVIGGLFGAAPPLFGWTAVTNSIDPGGLLLVLIIFVWTPPHFWALALERKDEYAEVGMPMLPVTHGEAYTRLHILLYTILLVLCTILPYLDWYVRAPLPCRRVSSWWWISCTGLVVLMRNNNPRAPMETFRYSIVYLGALFLVLLLDHYLVGARHRHCPHRTATSDGLI